MFSSKLSTYFEKSRVFPRPFTHGEVTSAGGQSVNGGGTQEGGHRPYGGGGG